MATVKAYFKHGHGAAPVRVSTPEEVDALIDALLKEPFDNSVVALYVEGRLNKAGVPDHELLVAVNADDQVGALNYMGSAGSFFAKGATSKYEEAVYYYMGHDREFPRDSALPLDVVRQAAKEFLASGGERPEGVGWEAAVI